MKWQWQADELHAYWHLTAEETDLLFKKTSHGRLGFVVSLKYFQNEGYFVSTLKTMVNIKFTEIS